MDEADNDDFDPAKAEFFEALGHATRIRILRALDARPLAFSELKHEVKIDSNGLLAFHLGRMNGLVRNEADGTYALTDDGREALDMTTNLAWSGNQEAGERGKGGVVRVRRKVFALLLVGLVVLASTTGLLIAQAARVGPFQGTIYFTIVMPNVGGSVMVYSGSTSVGGVSGASWRTYTVPYGQTIRGTISSESGYVLRSWYIAGVHQGESSSSQSFNITGPTTDITLVLVFVQG